MIISSSPASRAESIRRGRDWLLSRMQSDGSFVEATAIDHYYKTVFALSVAGCTHEAECVLNHVIARYLKDNGDLDGAGCPWFDEFRIYPHAWLALGAALRARFDVVRRLLAFLDHYRDPQSGGFYTNDHQRGGEQEIMTTGVCALAYLWAGRIEVARQTGTWFQRLYESQPDLKRGLYTVWRSDIGLVTEFPQEKARSYFVDAGKTVQKYFQYGVAAALMSSLSVAMGEKHWLELGQQFLSASRHCAEDLYREPQSGKLGWGAAWTYRLTRDPVAREIAEGVAAGLTSLQHANGWWATANVYQHAEAPSLQPSLDVSAELLAHLMWIRDCLDA